jgi:hypothetical protein
VTFATGGRKEAVRSRENKQDQEQEWMLEHMQTLDYCDGSPVNRTLEADGIPNTSLQIPGLYLNIGKSLTRMLH